MADWASTRPSSLSDSHFPAAVVTVKLGCLLGHGDVDAVGPRHAHRRRPHPRHLFEAGRHRAGVHVEQWRMTRQPGLGHHLRRRLVHVAGDRHRAGGEERRVEEEPSADQEGDDAERDTGDDRGGAGPAP